MTKRNLADPDWEPSDEDFAELLSHVGDDIRASQAALRRTFDAMVTEAAKGQENGVAPSSTNRSVQKRKLSGINGITEFAG